MLVRDMTRAGRAKRRKGVTAKVSDGSRAAAEGFLSDLDAPSGFRQETIST